MTAELEEQDLEMDDKCNNEENDSLVKINVGGRVFETKISTLKRIPNTRLATLPTDEEHFIVDRQEYYFDRNPTVFESVLEFYRTGELHTPVSLCGPQVKRELKYWGIDQRDVERCCWANYYGSAGTRDDLINFEKSLLKYKAPLAGKGCTAWKEQVWMFLDNPSSSIGATMFAVLSQLIIIISVISLILESIHDVQVPMSRYDNETLRMLPGIRQAGDTTVPPIELLYVDWFCYIFFIVEYIVRFIFCPERKMFVTNMYFIIDLQAIIWPIIYYVTRQADEEFAAKPEFMITLRALESLRVIRLLHIMRNIHAGEVVLYSLRKSMREIGLTILLFIIGTVCCGCLMYYAEKDNTKNFLDITSSIWWAMVTMTTVGYGDMYPTQSWGYLVGALTMVIGILLVGLTFSTIVNNFMLYFGHDPKADNYRCPRSYTPPSITEEVFNQSIYNADDKPETRYPYPIGSAECGIVNGGYYRRESKIY
ncbi:potassium voltage-gated channel protein egl-36-like [Tubulanus polymorphus]|uniref:potassium voltage-gated channel protein egl-36-like n=1 Tax=Tubulanus polymorphus TaxID=672921 RepID=UPI003DA594E5